MRSAGRSAKRYPGPTQPYGSYILAAGSRNGPWTSPRLPSNPEDMDSASPLSLFARGLTTQSNVVKALILRDVRTRFGGTLLGYVVTVAWPLTHAIVVMLVYLTIRRLAPIGSSASVFLATGILPYVLCLYPARMISMSISLNQPLLYFPVVKSFDLVLARCIVEIVTAFWVVVLFSFILYVFGVDIAPIYMEEAVAAVFVTIFLGVSIGYVGAVMTSIIRMWGLVLIVTMIMMYATSGAFLLPSMLPQSIQYWMTWNPLFHSVEWLRSAYYDGYGNALLDKNYLVGFAMINLFIGVVSERFVRRLMH